MWIMVIIFILICVCVRVIIEFVSRLWNREVFLVLLFMILLLRFFMKLIVYFVIGLLSVFGFILVVF